MNRLREIGWPYAGDDDPDWDPRWRALMAGHPRARPARVVEQHRTGYVVAAAPDAGERVESPPDWQRRPGYGKGAIATEDRAAVGDWVLVADGCIVALLPRHGAIKRGAAGEHYRQQVIAANVDTAFVVSGLDADFNPRRIERYLLLIGDGAEPVVVLTKADKCGDVEAAIGQLADIAAQGVAVRAVNAKDRDSLQALSPWLRPGRTVALVGSSGAGKSTLTNTLLGTEKMKTGAVRASDERGRHTTSHRALLPLPSGACLVDTPGMRELKPTGEEILADGGFADIEALSLQCRFRDCAHRNEPGCALRAAMASGAVEAARVANYLKLRDEVAGAAGQLATRLARKNDTRTQDKAPGKRPEGKHGKH